MKQYRNAFLELMQIRGKGNIDESELSIKPGKVMYKSPFMLGETVTDALAARAVAANDIYELRTGKRQQIFIDENASFATSLGGTSMTQYKNEDGEYVGIPKAPEFEVMESITQPWPTKDGRYFLPHFNLPHLQERVKNVLNCEANPKSVEPAVLKWNAEDLDKAIADANATGGILYTEKEWLEHPHGKFLSSLPVVKITKIADSDPVLLSKIDEDVQPLAGIKVLDLTRILAGPTCGISLAEHGADDLMVTSPSLPQVAAFVRDTSHGKRSCFLDYNKEEDAKILHNLVKEADIFVEGFRPSSMKKHGFGVEELSKENPGLIYVSINCFGPAGGSLSDRAGWDQVAQAVTGICFEQGEATNNGRPQLTPVYACDFLTGYLGAFGALLALAKRATEGGSYHVEVSLCQSAMLIQREGRVTDFENATNMIDKDTFEEYAIYDNNTIYGDLKSLGPTIRMSKTSARWNRTTPALGSSKPEFIK